MNTFEFARALKKIKPSDIREMGIEAAQYAESQIIEDSKQANAKGLTFSGGTIEGIGQFTDWIESGEFHKNLKFLENENIEFFLYANKSGRAPLRGKFSNRIAAS